MKQNNYRPYLTAEEVDALCTLLAATPATPTTPVLATLHRKLYTLHLKVQAGLSTPSYTSNPAPTLEEKLGLGAATATAATAPTPSPSDARLAAYNKKQRGEILSPVETELAETYEWEHNIPIGTGE